MSQTPKWASDVIDKYGNVVCLKCGKLQPKQNKVCIYCCDHDEIIFVESHEYGGGLELVCSICKYNITHFFEVEYFNDKYKIVRK